MEDSLFYFEERGVTYAPAWYLFHGDKLIAIFYDYDLLCKTVDFLNVFEV